MCVMVGRLPIHAGTHQGQIAIVIRPSASAPILASRDGYAASIASPIVGFAAYRNPSDGISAAAVSHGDHWTVCAATIMANDANTQSCGLASVRRVSAHASSAAPHAMKSAS